MICDVTPINPQTGYPDNSLPGSPAYPSHGLPGGGTATPPIVIPPLPPHTKPPVGTWPPPLPPNVVAPPIFIPDDPPGTIPPELPPGSVWPPVDPSFGVGGKILAVVWLVGIGYRYAVLQLPEIWPPTGIATPK